MNGLALEAEIDPATGSVLLPADQFDFSPEEIDILTSAESAALAKCARENLNIDWVAWGLSYDSREDIWTVFGPWTDTIAERYAFVRPTSAEGMTAVRNAEEQGVIDSSEDFGTADGENAGGGSPNSNLSDAQLEQVAARCGDDPEVTRFFADSIVQAGPWTDTFGNTYELMMKDSRTSEVFEDLRECYANGGLEFDEERPGLVTAAKTDVIDEEQIEMALKVANCQQETKSTDRLATVMADIQAPVIQEYGTELAAQRARIDNAVADAKEYIAAHPELFEPVVK